MLLCEAYVLGAGTLGTLALFVLDLLALSQLVEAGVFHRGAMKEELAPFAFDEAKALVGDDFLVDFNG